MYAYPERITDDFIAAMKRNEKVLPYLDLPIQHCDDRVLAAMGRRGSRADIEDAIRRLRFEWGVFRDRRPGCYGAICDL